MKLSDLKAFLRNGHQPAVFLPSGQQVAKHFHVTELGEVTKRFVDCGGKERIERQAVLQLWIAEDMDHLLTAERFLEIILTCEKKLGLGNLSMAVEFQGAVTKELYQLEISKDNKLQLVGIETACLALESCGVIEASPTALVGNLMAAREKVGGSCSPGSGCC